jgi:hypothetical protein
VDADRYQTLLRNIAVVAGNVVEGTPIQLTSDKVTLVGHPLNSGSAVVRDSNHSYVNDRDYLGIWPDKLLAVRTLLSRVSTHVIPTSTTAALADARFVGERLKLAVCRQAIGNAALTGFECFSVLDPALITDPTAVKAFDALQLKDNSLYNTLADWATTKIETVPTFSYPVAAFFAVPVHGQISYLNAMLNQFVLGSQSNNRGALNSAAKSYRDFAGVYSATSYLPTKGVIDMSDAAASARILEVLLKTTPPKSSNVRFTVYLPDAQDSFIVSGNNRLALVLLKAYTSLSQHSSAKTSEFQKSMKRLSTILQTMPRIDENSQLVTAQ